jgi:hypothetical protein
MNLSPHRDQRADPSGSARYFFKSTYLPSGLVEARARKDIYVLGTGLLSGTSNILEPVL